MQDKYEIEHIIHNSLSFEETKDIICDKIAKLIILEEKNIDYGNKCI